MQHHKRISAISAKGKKPNKTERVPCYMSFWEKTEQQSEKPDQWLPEANDEEEKMIITKLSGCGHVLYSAYVVVTCQPWNSTVKTSLPVNYA